MSIILNPDMGIVAEVRAGLKATGGFCPCAMERTVETLCPCHKLRTAGECCCGLYLNIERN
jgi:ferredoxin-thioredoxin reductase catalytic subunit